jgi:hypothetical protein
MAGPPVRASWDLTTSGVRKCRGVLSSQVKIPSIHQSIEGCRMSSLCRCMQTTCLRKSRPKDFWASHSSTNNPEKQTQPQKKLASEVEILPKMAMTKSKGGRVLRWYPVGSSVEWLRQVGLGSIWPTTPVVSASPMVQTGHKDVLSVRV